jgi:hypothetical protein
VAALENLVIDKDGVRDWKVANRNTAQSRGEEKPRSKTVHKLIGEIRVECLGIASKSEILPGSLTPRP